MGDLHVAASNITAALISSNVISVKGLSSEDTAKRAIDLYSGVLAELINRDKKFSNPYNKS